MHWTANTLLLKQLEQKRAALNKNVLTRLKLSVLRRVRITLDVYCTGYKKNTYHLESSLGPSGP